MMRFSNEELLCFHSITEGSPPFGIVIRPFREEELDEVVAKTRHLLEEKKILTTIKNQNKRGENKCLILQKLVRE